MSRTDEVLLEKVRHFAGIGMRPKVIAAELNIPIHSVYHIRKKVGLDAGPKKPLPESVVKQIIEGYEEHGMLTVAKSLNLTVGRVRHVLWSRNIGRPLGRGGRLGKREPTKHPMTVAVKMKILRRRAAFERKIADDFGLTLHFVQKFFRRHYAD